MSDHDSGQVAATAAEVYEEFFVPALFAPWPPVLLELAEVGPGHSALDVACGTGALARAAASLVGEAGEVVGLDINPGMLAVARSTAEQVRWQEGAAESLPFDGQSFDRVLSQFGLMFFADRQAALAEMLRVLKPDGMGCVAVWAGLEATPGYAAVRRMLNDLFGPDYAQSIDAPYAMGDGDALVKLCEASGARDVSLHSRSKRARFTSLEDWLYTEIRGWTLADSIDDAQYERIRIAAPEYLGEFVRADGQVEFETPAWCAVFNR